MIIRLSPSGPPIANSDGGTADVGTGFMLRLEEGTTSVDFGVLTAATQYEIKYDPATALAPFLRPRLVSPSPLKRYRATGAVDMFNGNAGTATITLSIWVSYDEAATWNQVAFVDSLIETLNRKHCRIDLPLTLGNALADPVLNGAPSMTIKMEVSASVPDCQISAPNGDGGTGFLQLSEHL